MNKHVATTILCAVAGASLIAGAAHAQSGGKPVRIIVGYAPGGGVDLTARLIAPGLSEALGQPVIVENRTGANGNIGTDAVVRAAPDGQTLLMGYNGNLVINPALSLKMPFDTVRDLTPIALAVVSTNLLVSHPSLPVRNVKELVAFAKSRPGDLNYASSGIGAVGHMAAELFAMTAGIKLQHIPYKGNGAAIAEVLAGQVPLMFSAPAAVIGHVRANKLRPLAVASERRPPGLESIPTFGEAGFPGVEASAWFGVFGPAGMQAAQVERLNAEIVRILKTPDVTGKLTQQGYDPAPSTPAGLAQLVKADLSKWAKVVQAAGIKRQ
jgi:tripartite-type tricarboxylate transporter receptor subunit TctC